MLFRILFFITAGFLFNSCGGKQGSQADSASAAEVNTNIVRVYTHRYFTADQQLFNQFTANTGIKVEVVKDTEENLLARMKAEADQVQADVFIAPDAWYLEEARKAGLLQPFSTQQLDRNVPTRYRDNEGHWTALDRGAVGLAFAKGKIDLRTLYTYSDITAPALRGKLLLGNPSQASNRGLVAGLIAVNGEAFASRWLDGVLKNRLEGVQAATDYDIIKALAAGQGTMALVPSNVLLQMKASGNPEFTTPASQVGFIFLTQPDKTSVFYIGGAGLLRNAPHRDFGVMLLEFLTGAEQQPVFTNATVDLPINPMTLPHDLFDEIGGFYEITARLNEVAARYEKADELMAKAGWK